MIITIDGPVGTGKSTVARHLAEKIGFIYFDTGAMYRSFTYGCIKNNLDIDNLDEVLQYLDQFKFEIKVDSPQKIYLVDGEDASQAIRTPEVTNLVSKVAAIKEIRQNLVKIQRRFAEGVNAVFEGRDMGTVVFPNAHLKIFLTGDAEVRAKRRFEEFKKKFPEKSKDMTLEKVIEDINRRDHMDSTRAVSPLKQADDAHEVDTTKLGIEEVVEEIYQLYLQHKD